MKHLQSIQINARSREEILPAFAAGFPYLATCAELEQFIQLQAPWHWHKAAELFYMESGTLEYTTPGGKWVFPAGSGGFVPPDVLHTSRVISSTEPAVQLLHLFEPSFLSGEAGSRIETRYILPLIHSVEMLPLSPEIPEQAEILRAIRRAFDLSDQEWGYELRLRGALSEIWLELLLQIDQNAAPKGRTPTDALIKAMMIYIQEHFAEPISVEQLAQSVHISTRACFRLFQENLHMTPVAYLRAYRLQKACQRLENSDMSITDIAIHCGFCSASYFGKLFRQRFHCSPLEYRKHWQDRDKIRHP